MGETWSQPVKREAYVNIFDQRNTGTSQARKLPNTATVSYRTLTVPTRTVALDGSSVVICCPPTLR
jgi:hypothetical protein